MYADEIELFNDTEQILKASIGEDITLERVNMGQTGYMYQFTQDGKTYLVKPGVNKGDMKVRSARALAQEAASNLQKIITPDTSVDVKVYGEGSFKVAVQEKIEGARSISKDEIIQNHAVELMGEWLIDNTIGNYDSDGSNFIIDSEGHLRGIDKEQSGKYFLTDNSFTMDMSDQKTGSRQNIYVEFFEYLRKNGVSEKDKAAIDIVVDNFKNLSDDEFIKIIKPYALARDSNNTQVIISSALERKHKLTDGLDDFLQEIYNASSK